MYVLLLLVQKGSEMLALLLLVENEHIWITGKGSTQCGLKTVLKLFFQIPFLLVCCWDILRTPGVPSGVHYQNKTKLNGFPHLFNHISLLMSRKYFLYPMKSMFCTNEKPSLIVAWSTSISISCSKVQSSIGHSVWFLMVVVSLWELCLHQEIFIWICWAPTPLGWTESSKTFVYFVRICLIQKYLTEDVWPLHRAF